MASSSKQNNEVEDNPILKNLENIKVSDPNDIYSGFTLLLSVPANFAFYEQSS